MNKEPEKGSGRIRKDIWKDKEKKKKGRKTSIKISVNSQSGTLIV